MISSIGSIPSDSSTGNQLYEHGKSETTWKTHALVVSGYLLITFGIALAAASFYMSTIIHPLLALATPVTPFAAGSFLLNHAGNSNLVPGFFKSAIPPFKGIENEGGNDCWINATMQMLLHLPAFADRIQAASSGFRIWNHPLEKVFSTFKAYHKGGVIHSQALRKHLEHARVTTISDSNAQDDPVAFLNYFVKKIDYKLPPLYEKAIRIYSDGKSEIVRDKIWSNKNPVRILDLAPYILDLDKPTLERALHRYFGNVQDSPTDFSEVTIQSFEVPPQDLLISLDQAATLTEKVTKQVKCPQTLTLSNAQIGKESNYTPDGFIFHSGQNSQSGHWMSVIKKEGKWWHISDDVVQEISNREVFGKMASASLIHYTKI